MQFVLLKALSSRLRDLCRREGRGTVRARGGGDDSKVTVSPRHSRDELTETVRCESVPKPVQVQARQNPSTEKGKGRHSPTPNPEAV